MRLVVGLSIGVALAAGVSQVPWTRSSAMAQTRDLDAEVLAELKGMHATLGRLVSAQEATERIQRATLALEQVQLLGVRLRELQAEERRIAARASEMRAATAALESSDVAVGANGLPLPSESDASGVHAARQQEHYSKAAGELQETDQRLQAVQRQIAEMKKRMTAAERVVDQTVLSR